MWRISTWMVNPTLGLHDGHAAMVERLVQTHFSQDFQGFLYSPAPTHSFLSLFLHLSWCFESLGEHRCIKDVAVLTQVVFLFLYFIF